MDGDSLALSHTAPSTARLPAACTRRRRTTTAPTRSPTPPNDGHGGTDTATVTITVRPLNDAPRADDQSVTTLEDTPLPVILTGGDLDGDPLTFTVVAGPSHGQLTGTAPSLTYTPASNFKGTDHFTFTTADGTTGSNVATVTVTVTPVDDPPVANDQSRTTPEDTPITLTLTANEPDGDPLTFTVVTGPAHGSLTGTAPNLVYTPAANYHGPDTVVFRANDGHSGSNLATVAITVTPVNDPPACGAAQIDGAQLWPPNHHWVALQIGSVTDADGDAVTVQATAVRQDEPVNGPADGNTSPDATLAPLQVRSERSGQGDGRVYHVSFRGTDAQGGTCTGTVRVCVPHDQGPPVTCGDGGPLVDSTQP